MHKTDFDIWFDAASPPKLPSFSELWQYKDMILLLVRREFVSRYKQTILGPAWAIVQPLLTTTVFTFIFGRIAGLGPNNVPLVLFYYLGQIVWQYFSTVLSRTSNTFVDNAYLMGKVYFPRLAVPIASIVTGLVSLGIQLILFIVFYIYFVITGMQVEINTWVILVPILIIQLGILGFGVGIIISSLTTKYRDLAMLVSFGVMLWMYITPIVYDVSIIPESLKTVYLLNPVTPVILIIRHALLGTFMPPVYYWVISILVTIAVLIIGLRSFAKVERIFTDTI